MSEPTTKQRNGTTNSQLYSELNSLKIPLADLRSQIVELMKNGVTEIPLGDLLWLIKRTYDDTK